MKVSFPLSLKVSLWLLLNLVLLAAAGVALLVAQGGLGWEALVHGAAGDRGQATANALAGEIAAARDDRARAAVIARFGSAYGADFFLYRNSGEPLAGGPLALPAAVRARLSPLGPRNGLPPPDRLPGPDDAPDDAGPPRPGREAPGRRQELGRGRIFVATGQPAGYWVGWRVPFQAGAGEFPEPATVFAHVTSRWAMLRLLNLQSWLVAGAAVLVLSVLFWLPFVHGITRALGQLTDATGRIAEGRFDTRVPEKRGDEIGTLGGSVNRMAARLDTLVNGQRRFLGDVAHELGSPLGRLQVAIEILETRAAPDLRPQVADVREEVQLMSTLVQELLAFTKAGLRPRDAALASVDLAALAARVLLREDPDCRANLAIPGGLQACADAELLERAVGNLVRNALRYGGAGTILLTARREGNATFVSVIDEGPGVPPEALARLGEPFYRPDAARTREDGGVGLGLAIVKSSVEACRGQVSFRNRSPRGFEAEIRLGQGP
jgi:two-component system sensor histidine kinase CpxA